MTRCMLQGAIQKLKIKEERPMLFEMRQYRIKDGKRAQWVKLKNVPNG